MGAEKESFYSAPPFDYEASVAEYLSTLKVTENGVIADIMRLDAQKKLEILDYPQGGLRIRLMKGEGLGKLDTQLWEFLKSKAGKDGIAEVGIKELSAYAERAMGSVVWESGAILGAGYQPAYFIQRSPIKFFIGME